MSHKCYKVHKDKQGFFINIEEQEHEYLLLEVSKCKIHSKKENKK